MSPGPRGGGGGGGGGGGDWGGATFGDPRTPEKAQRRLGGLPIKKKKKKKKKKNFTDFIFTDIIIHAKASSVQVMSVIIMSDNVDKVFKIRDRRHRIRPQILR